MSLDEIRALLTPEREDEQGFIVPERASDWPKLTDEELFRLHRKIARDNRWDYGTRLQNELTTRLIRALGAARESSDRASARLYRLTLLLVVLTVVIVAFTVVTALKS